MEDNIIWYNKDGRFYNCSSCSMPNCSSRNTTAKSNCLLDKHEVTAQEIDNKVMKANEAPEKLYVVDVTFPDYVDFDGSPINTKRIGDHDIEYIRTDAFIEKAATWIANRYQANGSYLCADDIDDFINYMKGG